MSIRAGKSEEVDCLSFHLRRSSEKKVLNPLNGHPQGGDFEPNFLTNFP